MSIHRIFWKLEIKRALGRLPQLLAGVVVLLFLTGTTALFASRALYGEQASGRIPVGVVLPEEELLAKKALSMIASLDSVNSLCDFLYLDRAGAMEGLKAGKLSAVMDVPEGLVRGIMEGTNVPVRIIFPQEAGVESRIFQELTDAGAGTLSAAQAGIYAGNQLCRSYGLESRIPLLEADLNRIFLSYSLPREDYFRHSLVNATGDLTTAAFYAASAYVLVLLLGAVPVSGYLLPSPVVLARKLRMAGVGPLSQVLARTAGLGVLFLAGSVELFLAAAALGAWGSLAGGWSSQSGAEPLGASPGPEEAEASPEQEPVEAGPAAGTFCQKLPPGTVWRTSCFWPLPWCWSVWLPPPWWCWSTVWREIFWAGFCFCFSWPRPSIFWQAAICPWYFSLQR